MKIIITEEQKKKLFIPRKLNKDDHRWMDHNNSQPIKNGAKINQYDEHGRKQGYWEEYYDNGKLYSKGSYKDDKEYGYWEHYCNNGQLCSKGYFKDGKQDGYWVSYWENGTLWSKGNYVDGFRDGYWVVYHINGEISRKGNYKDGNFIKNLTESEKKKLFIPRKLSKGDSRYDIWNDKQPIKTIDGKEIRINQYDESGRKQGYWEWYYPNGLLSSKGNYVDGKLDGYWEWYYSNGQLMCKGSYKDGRRYGYWEEYTNNGELLYGKK